MLSKLIVWGLAHPVEFGALFASAIAIVRGIYAAITRLVAPYPRVRAVVEGFAALGPDVLRFVLQLVRAITGRAIPSPDLDARDGELAALRAQVTELAGLRAEVLRLRPLLAAGKADAVTVSEIRFDPSARQTIAPETVASIHHATTLTGRGDSQSGRVELGVAGSLLVLVALVAVGLHAASCVPVRRFVLDHTTGVPSRGPCVVGAHRCDGLTPVVCSADHREWPALPRRADGAQRTCAPGVCVVDGDGGIAHCALSDGGAE